MKEKMKISIRNGEVNVYEGYLEKIKTGNTDLNLELESKREKNKKTLKKSNNNNFNKVFNEETEKARKK